MTLRALARAASISLIAIAFAVPAAAQTTVRVTRDRTTIWTADFGSTVAIVNVGTILTVVGERKQWYEVLVPGDDATRGFIFKSNVSPVAGTQPERSTAPHGNKTSSRRPHTVGIAGFGQFSYTRFSAQNSFQAVLGQGGGGFFGGGGEVRLGAMFVNGSIERFTKTGERVYVADGEVFRLGVPNTISLTPITATAGWRSAQARATPYVGGGIGWMLYKESSPFLASSANVASQFASYHVVGGLEFRNGWVATAFEVQYSRVPDSIGVGGASAAFQESDLGGIAGRIRILIGR